MPSQTTFREVMEHVNSLSGKSEVTPTLPLVLSQLSRPAIQQHFHDNFSVKFTHAEGIDVDSPACLLLLALCCPLGWVPHVLLHLKQFNIIHTTLTLTDVKPIYLMDSLESIQ